MSRLPNIYNWGSEVANINQNLYNQLNDTYSQTANAVNLKSRKNNTTTNPSSNSPVNKEFDIGDLWINSSSNTAWIMTSRTTAEAVTWTQIT